MSFWSALRRSYVEAWRFLWAVPLLSALIFGFEGLQHIVEWHIGMYANLDAARAVEHHPARMVVGVAKVAWLLILQYWVTRFVVSGGSTGVVFARDPVAVRKFSVVFALSMALAIFSLWLPVGLEGLGISASSAALTSLGFLLITFPIGAAVTLWGVSAALGDPDASLIIALRRAPGSIAWGLALMLVAILPLMAIHYALGIGAIGRPSGLGAAMLTVDAFVVAILGLVLNTVPVFIAARMAQRHGAKLHLPKLAPELASQSAAQT